MQASSSMKSSTEMHSSSQAQSVSKMQSSSQSQSSATMAVTQLSSSEQELVASAASRGLVRQNTFTKDSIELSPEPTARPVATDQSNARLLTSGSKGTTW